VGHGADQGVEHAAGRRGDRIQRQGVQGGHDDRHQDQGVDDQADDLREGRGPQAGGQSHALGEAIGPGSGQQARRHALHDPGHEPTDGEDHRGRQQVGQEAHQLGHHLLHRRQQAGEAEGAEDGRQEQQQDQPVGGLGQRAGHGGLGDRFAAAGAACVQPPVDVHARQHPVQQRPHDVGQHHGHDQQADAAQQPRQVAGQLAEHVVQRLGDQRQAQSLEDRHQHEDHEQVEDATAGAGRQVRVGQLHPAGQAVGQTGAAQQSAHAGAHGQGHEPAHHQNGQGCQDPGRVQGHALDDLVQYFLHDGLPPPSERRRGNSRVRQSRHDWAESGHMRPPGLTIRGLAYNLPPRPFAPTPSRQEIAMRWRGRRGSSNVKAAARTWL